MQSHDLCVDPRTLALESLRIEAIGNARMAVIAIGFQCACALQLRLTPGHLGLLALLGACGVLAALAAATFAACTLKMCRVRSGRASANEIHGRVVFARCRQVPAIGLESLEEVSLKERTVELAFVIGLAEAVAASIGLVGSSAAIVATVAIGGGLLRTHFERRRAAISQLSAQLREWDALAEEAQVALPA